MRLIALLASLLLLPATVWADPPARVGRLAALEGEALLFIEPDRGWETAFTNATLTSQNSVWTEPGSRAELRVGSTALRLGAATQVDIPRLDDDAIAAHLQRGSLAVRVRFFERDDSLILTTANARFQVRANGRYRLDADPASGESRFTVFAGEARLEARGGFVQLQAGRSIRVSGPPESEQFSFDLSYETALDVWAADRDARYAGSESARHLPARMTGWEDLDNYGQWRTEPELGPVWFPSTVSVGWAPYRYGRWTHVRPWGWTWVDDAPWGYAPFHYGRWVLIGNRWAWSPGRYVSRPVWAPALVGWVGGSGWSVSINTGPIGVVGWYPLSPFERYDPWYAVRPAYVNNVNAVVITNRPPRYRPSYREWGYTVVPRDHFGTFRPVQGAIVRVPYAEVAVQPTRPGNVPLPVWTPRPRPEVGPLVPPPRPGVVPPPVKPVVQEPTRPRPPSAGPRPVMPEPAPQVPIVKPAPPPAPVIAPQVPAVAPLPPPAPAAAPQAPAVRPQPAYVPVTPAPPPRPKPLPAESFPATPPAPATRPTVPPPGYTPPAAAGRPMPAAPAQTAPMTAPPAPTMAPPAAAPSAPSAPAAPVAKPRPVPQQKPVAPDSGGGGG